MQSTNLLRAMA